MKMKASHSEQYMKYRIMSLRQEAAVNPEVRETAIRYMKKAIPWCRLKGWDKMVRHIGISLNDLIRRYGEPEERVDYVA